MRRAAGMLLALLAGACASPSSPPPTPPETAFQRGMVYGIFSRSGRPFHRANLEAMAALGIDHVQLVVPHPIPSIHSTGPAGEDPLVTPSRESLAQAVSEARRLGMRVFLFPILFVQDLHGDEWRGALRPLDWEVWWERYAALILDEARWAAEHGVDILSVGSELCSAEAFDARWRDLILRVRAVFPGRVTYSANWDHLQGVTFADALDFVGMNAYHEVGKGLDPVRRGSVPALVQAWEEVLQEVEDWQSGHGLDVVVTEVGYQSRSGTLDEPWNYAAPGEPAPGEQDLGYRAFIRAWSGRPWFRGAYFYIWWDDPENDGMGYTPRGKPAAETLNRWYTQGTLP